MLRKYFLSHMSALVSCVTLSSSVMASVNLSEDENDTSTKNRTSSLTKMSEDPFVSYKITLNDFSSKKAPYTLSLDEIRDILSTQKALGAILAQDKKKLYKIAFVCTREVRPQDIKDTDVIFPLVESRSTTPFDTVEIPYAVMRDNKIALSFKLIIEEQSKQKFLDKTHIKKKIDQSLSKPKKMLELQVKELGDLLPSKLKRHLDEGDEAISDFNPHMPSVSMQIFEAFLKDGVGRSKGGLCKKTLLVEGGYVITFSSESLNELSKILPTDYLSFMGYSLSKRKRRNGKDAQTTMTYHYELLRLSATLPYIKGPDGEKHPNLEQTHTFDFSIKRKETEPDLPQESPSLIRKSRVQLQVRGRMQRPRSRSFASSGQGVDLSNMGDHDFSESSTDLKESSVAVASSSESGERLMSSGSSENTSFVSEQKPVVDLKKLQRAYTQRQLMPKPSSSTHTEAHAVKQIVESFEGLLISKDSHVPDSASPTAKRKPSHKHSTADFIGNDHSEKASSSALNPPK